MNEIDFLQECLNIPSFSGDETAFSQFLSEKMAELGFEVRCDPAGNTIGQIGDGEPVILLSSHLDTVIGTIPVEIKDEKLYGRGAIDDKGMLAANIIYKF